MRHAPSFFSMLVVGLLVGCGGAKPPHAAPVEPAAASTTSAAPSAAPAVPPASEDDVKPDPFKPVDSVADASGRLSFPAPSIANHPEHVPLHIKVPKGTRAHAEATDTRILGGPHFNFVVVPNLSSVDDYPDNMKDSVKNLKVVAKTEGMVVYSGIEERKKEDGSGDKETHGGFHFLVTKGGLGAGFQCSDWAAVDLTKKDVDAMVEACQSLSLD